VASYRVYYGKPGKSGRDSLSPKCFPQPLRLGESISVIFALERPEPTLDSTESMLDQLCFRRLNRHLKLSHQAAYAVPEAEWRGAFVLYHILFPSSSVAANRCGAAVLIF